MKPQLPAMIVVTPWFADGDALLARLGGLLRPDVTVLIKGSRVNRLERIAAALVPAGADGR